MTRLRRRPRGARVALAAVLLAAGCSIETAGAPKGDVHLVVRVDDAADLTPGHNVQSSNVVVGSVADIRLRGYEAEVEISIVDDFRVPEGTTAMVRRTSLLGEHYLDLQVPEGFDPDEGSFLEDGDRIEVASTQPGIEELAEQAAAVIGSLTADDLAASLDAVATGIGGRGDVLNQLVQDAGLVVDALADQQAAIAGTTDSLSALGRTLAPDAERFAATLDDIATATGTIADSRERMVATVDALVDLASTTNDAVLEPHADRLVALLEDLRPVLGQLNGQSDVIVDLIRDMDRFVAAFPTAVHNGNVLLSAWVHLPGTVQEVGNLLDSLGLSPLADLLEGLGLTP